MDDSLTIISHVLHHLSPQLSPFYHHSSKKKKNMTCSWVLIFPNGKNRYIQGAMQWIEVLSLTPCLRSTLRTAHVTAVFMRRKQDTRSPVLTCVCIQTSLSRLRVFKAISRVRVAGVCSALRPVSRPQLSHRAQL